jgi:hypothetical protein
MLNLILFSVLVGAVLGLRLKVLILVPTTIFFVIGIAGIGATRGDELRSIASAIVVVSISLQLGYLAGSTTRFVTAAVRVARRVDSLATLLLRDRQAIR